MLLNILGVISVVILAGLPVAAWLWIRQIDPKDM
jgi:hypothetical protein